MANGEQHFENTAKNADHKAAHETSENLLADAQKAPPTKAIESAPKASDAPAAPTEKAEATDKVGNKIEQAVTANLQDSAREKIASLQGSPEGQKLLAQEHTGGSVTKQWQEFFPLAYDQAKIGDLTSKK